ncbi:hypothetical protein DD238_004672 [Peronospora effusa]|uniref:Glucosidase 2 subunit beta n=1 Tax=Peronospora effusa TaxID=542832 RepID=A0A3M6VS74_9STRA|nr:hypothetical protein DD238_004672 [Peronospora effusa]RQM17046.1 hypothetical protein DD237_002059 [Peronospora effusa]
MTPPRLATSLTLLAISVTASDWHGVSPELQQKLRIASSFTCDNGQQRLDLLQLNDNYCDCEDGSDEPGTSACSHTAAVFHCVNAGYFSADIPTSRVNDGVCDCCDASDEYASGASCASNCYEVMQSFKADKSDLIEQVEHGLKDRVALVTKAQKLWDEEEEKKQQLETSTTSLRMIVEQVEVRKQQEERLEQEEKERLVAARKHEIVTQLGLLDLTKEQLASIIVEIGRGGMSAKQELLSIIRKEREVAVDGEEKLSKSLMDERDEVFRERDDARQKETQRIEKAIEQRRKDKEEKAKEAKEALEKEAAAADDDETVTESETEVDVGVEADVSEEEEDLTLPEVETHPFDLLYDELTASERYERNQAAVIRKLHESKKEELKEEENKLIEVQKLLDKDYGVDNLFFGLRDECVESDAGQYKYKVCFFGKATQDFTKLGDMEDIKGPKMSDGKGSDKSSSISPEDLGTIVKEIKFSNGENCWNGPKRSLTVKLECGPEPMKLYDIEEPSTCVYIAKLRTPAVCSEDDRERILTSSDARTAPHHIEIEVPPTL